MFRMLLGIFVYMGEIKFCHTLNLNFDLKITIQAGHFRNFVNLVGRILYLL